MAGAPSDHDSVRVAFKDSIFALFMHFTGLQGQHAHIFGIHHLSAGGVHIIIIPCHLRFDSACGAVVLDCMVLPLSISTMPSLQDFLAGLMNPSICTINVDTEELKLRKQVLPSFVERCRTWKHRKTCEHLATGKVPLSTTNGEQTLYSCGNGKFPSSLSPPEPTPKGWAGAARYFTRAAISPSFSVPLVEQSFQPTILYALQTTAKSTCQRCSRHEKWDGGTLLTCSRCHVAQYCSIHCHKDDWKLHKASYRASS